MIAPSPPLTFETVTAKLDEWRERLDEAKRGDTNNVLTVLEIRRELDRLLDDLLLLLRR